MAKKQKLLKKRNIYLAITTSYLRLANIIVKVVI